MYPAKSTPYDSMETMSFEIFDYLLFNYPDFKRLDYLEVKFKEPEVLTKTNFSVNFRRGQAAY